jgi:DNA-binding transcriptional LysR family regulator
MTTRININQLTSLRYLLEEKHVSRAAIRACVSQSAMSKTLQSLRNNTGDPLLIRDGNDMTISPYASSILEKLTPALEQLERVLLPTCYNEKESTSQFTIASSDFFCSQIFPKVFSELDTKPPNISYRILDWGPNKQKQLEAGQIDIVAAAFLTPPDLNDSIRGVKFGQDHLVCLMSKSHYLSNKTITMNDYLENSHICISGGGEKVSIVEEYLSKFNSKKNIKMSVPYYSAAIKIVEEGDCLLTLPLNVAKKMSQSFNVCYTDLPYTPPKLYYYLLWSKLTESDESHFWLRCNLLGIISREFNAYWR